jgi:hypothetical protein
MHTSPNTAALALLQLQNVPQITGILAPNEIRVVLGDFNVDPFQGLNFVTCYAPLLAPPGGYTLALDPRPPGGGINAARKPYCMTHLLPRATATPYNNQGAGTPTDPYHNVYPRFGYMGAVINGHVSDTGAIDNIMTAYGPGAAPAPPAVNNITVVNKLAGTPYNFLPAPANVTPELTGGLPFNSVIPPASNMLSNIPPAMANFGGVQPGTPAAPALALAFSSWPYYGVVRSTSDHLPLVIDV